MKSTHASRRVAAIGALAGIALATCVIPQAASAAPGGIDMSVSGLTIIGPDGRTIPALRGGGDGRSPFERISYDAPWTAGTTITAQVTIRNEGTAPVTKAQLGFDSGPVVQFGIVGGGGSYDVVDDQLPGTFTPGASYTVSTSYKLTAPLSVQTLSVDASIGVHTSDANHADNNLSGEIYDSGLGITAKVAPASAPLGVERTGEIEVTNDADYGVVIGSDIAFDLTDVAGAEIELAPDEIGRTLAPDETAVLKTAAWTPTLVGPSMLMVSTVDLNAGRPAADADAAYEVTEIVEARPTVEIDGFTVTPQSAEAGTARGVELSLIETGAYPIEPGADYAVTVADETGDVVAMSESPLWPDELVTLTGSFTPEEVGQHELAATVTDLTNGTVFATSTVPFEVTAPVEEPVVVAPEPEVPVVDEEPATEEPQVEPEPEAPVVVPDDPGVEPTPEEPAVEEEPVVEAPVDTPDEPESPIEEAPVVEVPVDTPDEPESPIKDEPVVEVPVIETPVDDEPVVEAPAPETPIEDEPIEGEPAPEAPVETPVVEEPVEIEPVPTPNAPVIVDEPITEEPTPAPASTPEAPALLPTGGDTAATAMWAGVGTLAAGLAAGAVGILRRMRRD